MQLAAPWWGMGAGHQPHPGPENQDGQQRCRINPQGLYTLARKDYIQERQGVPAHWGDPARGVPTAKQPTVRESHGPGPPLEPGPLTPPSQRGAQGGEGSRPEGGSRLEGG